MCRVDIVKLLCRQPTLDWQVRDAVSGGNALHCAILGGSESVLRLILGLSLLFFGVCVYSVEQSPLYDQLIIADQNRAFCVVKSLVPFQLKDNFGDTPLDLAISTKQFHLAEYFLRRGMSFSFPCLFFRSFVLALFIY
jgi:ankyrin repeat protein